MLASNAQPAARPAGSETREMPRMMLALGIEPAFLKAEHPALYAGMESVCAACDSRETCSKDLAARKAAEHFTDYCGNAATLSLLSDRPDLRAE